MVNIPKALTIAGSDSGGCAGIQADLKTFAALGVHGMSVVTSVTAQNTQRVLCAEALSLSTVETQIQAIAEDIPCDAVKTGMIPDPEMVQLVADCLGRYSLGPLVVDPVLVTTSGHRLVDEKALDSIRHSLIPLALVVTPNFREAEILTGSPVGEAAEAERAAREICSWGARAVVVTGGDSPDLEFAVDYYFDGHELVPLVAPRSSSPHTHGSGCTFASAIAAGLANGLDLEVAIRRAKQFVRRSIEASFPVGKGRGPLGHFHELWEHLHAIDENA